MHSNTHIAFTFPIADAELIDRSLSEIKGNPNFSLHEGIRYKHEYIGPDLLVDEMNAMFQNTDVVMIENRAAAYFFCEWLHKHNAQAKWSTKIHFALTPEIASIMEQNGIPAISAPLHSKKIDLVELMIRLRQVGSVLIPLEQGALSAMSPYFEELQMLSVPLFVCKRIYEPKPNDNHRSPDIVVVDHGWTIECLEKEGHKKAMIVCTSEKLSDLYILKGFNVFGVLGETPFSKIIERYHVEMPLLQGS